MINGSQFQMVEVLGTLFFILALLHSFSVKRFQTLALSYRPGSILENLFHLFAEVEVVFGFWSGILFLALFFLQGPQPTLDILNTLDFHEVFFVFMVMTISATRPVLSTIENLLQRLAVLFPVSKGIAYYFILLTVGPILGSIVTEPAAMAVTASLLLRNYMSQKVSKSFKYWTLATLFTNISIGGVLSHFAAPPVIMVSHAWSWDTPFMLLHFGWRAFLAVFCNSLIACLWFRKELKKIEPEVPKRVRPPVWIFLLHLFFLGLAVLSSKQMALMMGIFMFFLGVVAVTEEYQEELKLRESLLVGFFLGGLVFLGSFQEWWLKPLISGLSATSLYFYSTALTSVVDNAAITYLGSLSGMLSPEKQFALVAGAVSGGGLTVIANAPNPAGYSILKESFGKQGLSPLGLFLAAVLPTLIVIFCFWVLP